MISRTRPRNLDRRKGFCKNWREYPGNVPSVGASAPSDRKSMRTRGHIFCNRSATSSAFIPAPPVSMTARSTGRCCWPQRSRAALLDAVMTTNPAFSRVDETFFRTAPPPSPTTTAVLSESSVSILLAYQMRGRCFHAGDFFGVVPQVAGRHGYQVFFHVLAGRDQAEQVQLGQ